MRGTRTVLQHKQLYFPIEGVMRWVFELKSDRGAALPDYARGRNGEVNCPEIKPNRHCCSVEDIIYNKVHIYRVDTASLGL